MRGAQSGWRRALPGDETKKRPHPKMGPYESGGRRTREEETPSAGGPRPREEERASNRCRRAGPREEETVRLTSTNPICALTVWSAMRQQTCQPCARCRFRSVLLTCVHGAVMSVPQEMQKTWPICSGVMVCAMAGDAVRRARRRSGAGAMRIVGALLLAP